MKTLIKINRISKFFGEQQVLHDFSLEIKEGERLVIMGPSGSGKSTLLNLIAKTDQDYTGVIERAPSLEEGIKIPYPIVFQENENLLPWKTVAGNLRVISKNKEVTPYLDMVGLLDAKDKKPHQLSGGMKQRVGIARAIMCDSKVLLMDEPFSNLDGHLREKMQALIIEMTQRLGQTLIFVTHDEVEAKAIATRIIRI